MKLAFLHSGQASCEYLSQTLQAELLDSEDIYNQQDLCIAGSYEDVDNVIEIYQQYTPNLVIVFYQQAEHYFANALRSGEKLSEAAVQWTKSIEQLMAFQRRNRAVVKLVNLEQSLANPISLKEKLETFSVEISEFAAEFYKEDMALITACQYVSQTPTIRKLNKLLQASSVPLLSDNEVMLDLDASYTVHCEDMEVMHNAIQKYQNEAILINNERDLILLQLQQVQEELEGLFKQSANDKKSLETEKQISTELQAHIAQKKTQHAEIVALLEQEVAEIRSVAEKQKVEFKEQLKASESSASQTDYDNLMNERDLILLQLHNVQEELEHYYLALQASNKKAETSKNSRVEEIKTKREITNLTKRLDTQRSELAAKGYQVSLHKKELEAIKRTVFWKTSAPVRGLANVINKNKLREQKLQQDVTLILASEFFDSDWYLQTYPDVKEAGIHPAEHYLKYGGKEGRMPGPLFLGDLYLERYPDVAEAEINPLLHFVKFGVEEGREASPKLLQNLSGETI